jgi:hypothetical protein
MSKPYRPSNGTEGEGFIDQYCMNCLHCDPDPEGKKQCDILCRSLCYNVSEPEYPTEWQWIAGEPKCTAHVKWDWGNDGDPDDPENPNVPPSQDPDQLCFPFELEFIENGTTLTETRQLETSN